MITSASNGRIKEIVNLIQKAKVRREKKVFIIEGRRLFSEVPRELIEEIYVSDTFLEKQENRELLEGLKYETVKEEVFRKISDTKTPQGILAVVKQPQYSLEQMILQDLTEKPSEHAKQPLLVILEDIQDPGNLGTILRTADALEIPVALLEGCADPYSHKVVRASMGAVFRTQVVQTTWAEAKAACRQAGIPIAVTALNDTAKDLRNAPIHQMAVVIGSEGQGVRQEILEAAEQSLIIPMNPNCESLNAAIAAAIVMWQMK